MGRRRSIGLERKHVMLRAGDFDKLKRYYPQINPSAIVAKLVTALIEKNERLQAVRMPKLTLEVDLDEFGIPTQRSEPEVTGRPVPDGPGSAN